VHFIIDAQLPPALARLLESRGHEAKHLADLGLLEAEDLHIWRYASQHKAVIVTKDEDFVILSTLTTDGPAIVWVRVGNTRKQVLLAWFERLLPAIEQALANGEKLLELT
jgi:predicted nuclease of predicted toxin-antitoxin system